VLNRSDCESDSSRGPRISALVPRSEHAHRGWTSLCAARESAGNSDARRDLQATGGRDGKPSPVIEKIVTAKWKVLRGNCFRIRFIRRVVTVGETRQPDEHKAGREYFHSPLVRFKVGEGACPARPGCCNARARCLKNPRKTTCGPERIMLLKFISSRPVARKHIC